MYAQYIAESEEAYSRVGERLLTTLKNVTSPDLELLKS
jgi:hypothetical protein